MNKECARDNLPISDGLGNSPAVPFAGKYVENEFHAFLELAGTLAAGVVCLVPDGGR